MTAKPPRTSQEAPGDTVKLILEIDPAKTDFDQTPVEATDTVD